VIAKSGEKALLLDSLSGTSDLAKAAQTYELKQNDWLKDSQNSVYFAADFDGDAQQDLLQLDAGNGGHRVFFLEKNLKFKTANKLPKTVHWGLKNNQRLIIRDFNQDGRDDVFALSRDGSQPHVLLYSDGQGGFTPADGKLIPVRQASLDWTDNAAGIIDVTRKSDNQPVLFRAYNQSERNQVAANCLGWIYDPQADTATEYCPASTKGSHADFVHQRSAVALNDCPIEMSMRGGMTTLSGCDPGSILPDTPMSAPQVSYGPHAAGAQINVVLANIYDYSILEYQVWSQDAFGGYNHLGSVSAPSWGNPSPAVSLKVSLSSPGTYSLMYRACSAAGCSGFGPAATIAIHSLTTMHTVSVSAGFGGSIAPAGRSVPNGQTTTFTVTPFAGYIASASGCAGSLAGTTYTTGPITAACSVSVNFSPQSYTVSATAGANGYITPPSRIVSRGHITTFTVAPNAGYTAVVSGCGGRLSGATYTTGAITSACTVSATFTPIPSNPDPVTQYEYDARGRLVKVHDNKGVMANYLLDHAGNRLSVSDQTAPAMTPTITSFVAPQTVSQGGTATISWTSRDSLSCALAIFGDYSSYPNLPPNGSVSLRLYLNTGVTLSCYYGSLSAVAAKNIRVNSLD
jgi:hypothetical protein